MNFETPSDITRLSEEFRSSFLLQTAAIGIGVIALGWIIGSGVLAGFLAIYGAIIFLFGLGTYLFLLGLRYYHRLQDSRHGGGRFSDRPGE